MTSIIFSKAAGQVQSLPDQTLPANVSLRLEGWGGFTGFKSIITRVTVAAKGNYQFLHTLGGQVFIYVFGDRIGQLSVTGVAFDSTCGDPAGTLGIEHVLNYFSANRMANRKTPIKLTIGATTTLQAYLLDTMADVADTKARLWQFTLVMALVPRDEAKRRRVNDDDDDDVVEPPVEDEVGPGFGGGIWRLPPADPIPPGERIVLPPLSPYLSGEPTDTGGASLDTDSTTELTASGYSTSTDGPNTGLVVARP